MFSEGGEKFRALEKNKQVCLAIYDRYDGFGNLRGLQIAGRAGLVEPFSPEYAEAAAFRKIPLAALKKLPEPLNLIKVVPLSADYLDSALKKKGYGSRQHLEF